MKHAPAYVAHFVLAGLALSCHALSPISHHPGAGILRLKGLGDLYVPTDLLISVLEATQPPRGLPRDELQSLTESMPRRALEARLGRPVCKFFLSSSPTKMSPCKHDFCTDFVKIHKMHLSEAFHAAVGSRTLYESCNLRSITGEGHHRNVSTCTACSALKTACSAVQRCTDFVKRHLSGAYHAPQQNGTRTRCEMCNLRSIMGEGQHRNVCTCAACSALRSACSALQRGAGGVRRGGIRSPRHPR